METIVCISETIICAREAITAVPEAIVSMAERIDSLMAVIADRVKTHPSHASTIADDVERIDNEAELIVTNPTTISSKAVGASEVLTGPGYFNLDFSLGKNIPVKQLGDSGVLEFRGEFFNMGRCVSKNSAISQAYRSRCRRTANQAIAPQARM